MITDNCVLYFLEVVFDIIIIIIIVIIIIII